MKPKHEAFVREYLVDFNATAAAIRAGYSPKTASQIGHKLLRRADITVAVHQASTEAAEANAVKVGRTLSELKIIAFTDIADFVTWDQNGAVRLRPIADIDPRKLAAISEVREIAGPGGKVGYVVKMHDKVAALQSLGKYCGMFVDRHEVKHKGVALGQVVFTLPPNGRRPPGREG